MATNSTAYMNAYYNRGRKEVLNQLGRKCAKCGVTNDLEIHHIKELNGDRPNGQLARLIEWRMHTDNLQVLCKECHLNLHRQRKYKNYKRQNA